MKTLVPDPNSILPVRFPEDTVTGVEGDDWSALTLEQHAQQLLNRTERNKIDIAALLLSLNNLVVLNADDDTAILSAVAAINSHIMDIMAAHDAAAIGISTVIPGLPGTDARAALVSARAQIAALEGIVNNGGTLEVRVDALETRQTIIRVQSHLLATLGSYNDNVGMAGLAIIGTGGGSAPTIFGNTAATSGGVSVWTALDAVPPEAKGITVRIFAATRAANDGPKMFLAAPISVVGLLGLTENEKRTYAAVEMPVLNAAQPVGGSGRIGIELPTGAAKTFQGGLWLPNGVNTLGNEYTHWTMVLEDYWL